MTFALSMRFLKKYTVDWILLGLYTGHWIKTWECTHPKRVRCQLIRKGTYILSFGKIRLCTETICGVPFGVRLIRILMRFIINLKRISNIPVGKPVNRIINVSGDKLQYTVFKRLENGEYIYNITWVRRIQNNASCVSMVLCTLMHGFFGNRQ